MKNIEYVRRVLVSKFGNAFQSVRYQCASLDNGTEIADKLRGPEGDETLALAVDTVLRRLGFEIAADAADPNSATRRAARKGQDHRVDNRVQERSEVVRAT